MSDTLKELRAIFSPIFEKQNASFAAAFDRLAADFGVTCELYTIACPVQIHLTTAKGEKLYYRERWGEWCVYRVQGWDWYKTDEDPVTLGEGEIGAAQTDSWSDGDEFERIMRTLLPLSATP